MKVELLYFEGCPNHEQALKNLADTMKELGIEEKIEVVNVIDDGDAMAKRFLGSPSIRINGKDLENAADADYSMRCRRYRSKSGMQGHPPVELIGTFLKGILARGSGYV